MSELLALANSRRPYARSGELVITAHGFLATSRSMLPLNVALRSAGYETLNWKYPSLRGSILSHAERLSELLLECVTRRDMKRIHFVTHSMGGIVARVAIERAKLETFFDDRCGRLVMLAPPNAGSRLASLPLGPIGTWFPQLVEMSESPASLVNGLASPAKIAVGVIAAAHDFVVRSDATHLKGQQDHVVVRTTHQRLAKNREAIELAIRFLDAGRFSPVANERTRIAA